MMVAAASGVSLAPSLATIPSQEAPVARESARYVRVTLSKRRLREIVQDGRHDAEDLLLAMKQERERQQRKRLEAAAEAKRQVIVRGPIIFQAAARTFALQ